MSGVGWVRGGSGVGPDGVRMGSGWGPDGGPDGVKVGVRMGSVWGCPDGVKVGVRMGSGWGQLWGPDGVGPGWVRGGSGDPPNRGPGTPQTGVRTPLAGVGPGSLY